MPGATRLNDQVTAMDTHGRRRCWCRHYVTGQATSITRGSPNVFINDKPAARRGDQGRHQRCCGSNTFTHVEGSNNVFVNGKALVRRGDQTSHCGGSGRVVVSSDNVIVN